MHSGAADGTGPALFVSWIRHHGRSAGLSRAIGAEAAFIAVGTLTQRRSAPARHAVQALRTLVLLLRRRPRVLWVMAPPTTLVVLAVVWRRLTGCVLVVDAHTGAVLDPQTGAPRSLRWLRRSDLVVVTTRRLSCLLLAAGVEALPLHDPPLADLHPCRADGPVLLPASWYSDEPWQDVVSAAALLPELRFAITGRPPRSLDRSGLPANLDLTGFLPREQYDGLLASAPVVLALTTREDTMQRAAYEAVAAGRPVVASGTQALREHLTSGAVFTTGGGEDLADAVRRVLADEKRLAGQVVSLREQHRARFAEDLDAVQRAVRDAR